MSQGSRSVTPPPPYQAMSGAGQNQNPPSFQRPAPFAQPRAPLIEPNREYLVSDTAKMAIGLIATVPLLAAVGAVTAYTFFSSITPLAGAIIMGTSSSIYAITMIACKIFGMKDTDARIAALAASIFLTVAASTFIFSYIGLPLLATYQFVLLGIGAFIHMSVAISLANWIAGPKNDEIS